MTMIVTAARVIDGTGAAPIPNGVVVVDGDQILEIGNGPIPVEGPQVIDLGDRTLIPGLVDTHIHISGSGTLKAREGLANESAETLLLRSAANARTMLRAGVTTVRDCGTKNEVIFPFKNAVKAGVVPSPRLMVAGAVLTTTGGHAYIFGRETDGPDDMRKAVRSQVKLGADFIKIMVTGGILTQFRPNIIQFELEEMKVAVDEANKLGVHVAAHCHNKAGMEVSAKAGVRTIEHGIYLDENGLQYDPDLGARIRDSGLYVNPSNAFAVKAFLTGRTDQASDRGPGYTASIRKKRVETWRRQYEDKVPLVPGSDAGWYATPFEDFARMPELMVSEIGMTPMEALVACTRTAAESIDLAKRVGTIEPGKFADLVAVEGDPSVDITALWNVRWVMLGGQVAWPLSQPVRTEIND